jgi:hypothetical protein
MKKNVAAIRSAGRATGLIAVSIISVVFFFLLLSQASRGGHFRKISICETRAKNTEVGRIVGCRGKCFPSGRSESVLIPQAGTRLHYAPIRPRR